MSNVTRRTFVQAAGIAGAAIAGTAGAAVAMAEGSNTQDTQIEGTAVSAADYLNIYQGGVSAQPARLAGAPFAICP